MEPIVNKIRERIAMSQSVTFADNELLYFKRDFCNSCQVVSTGYPDEYVVKQSIRKGIVDKRKMNLEEVANLYVQFMAEEIHPTVNYLFPKGLEDVLIICRNAYKRDVEPKLKSDEKPRGYKSLHATEYIDTV